MVFLEHKKTYRLVRGEVPEEEYTLPSRDGRREATRRKPHSSQLWVDAPLLLGGGLNYWRKEAVNVEVVDLRTLTPLDTSTVLESVKKTGKLLVVHEDNITGGVGAEVAALAAEHAFDHLDGPIVRLWRARRTHDALRPKPGRRLYAQHTEDCRGNAQVGVVLMGAMEP